jgi:hypothetical protein
VISFFWFSLWSIFLAKPAIFSRTLLQRFSQQQKRRMPLSNAIVAQAVMSAIVAKVVEITLLHPGRFGVSVNISQRIQSPSLVSISKTRAVISLLPKMTCAVQHSVEAHSRIPVEPVHDFGKVFRLLGFK